MTTVSYLHNNKPLTNPLACSRNVLCTFAESMTKRTLFTGTSVFLALVIFLSTSGFMVFVHHCHHHQETFSSLFINFNDRAHQPCPADGHSCCHSKGTAGEVSLESQCCENIEYWIKISPDSEPAKSGPSKLRQPAPLHQQSIFAFSNLCRISDTPPAPLLCEPLFSPSGKCILLQHRQLKLDGCDEPIEYRA